VIMRVGIPREEVARPGQRLHRVVHLAQRPLDAAQALPELALPGHYLDRLPVGHQGFLRLPHGLQGLAQVVVCQAILRPHLHRAPQDMKHPGGFAEVSIG